MQHFEKLKPVAQLALRWALALIFLYHGYPKLFTHRHAAYAAFPRMGFPWYFALIAGIVECFGGCLLVAGLFTRMAALLLTAEMSIAIWRVGLAHGVGAVGNYEFPLIMAAGAFTVLVLGAGPVSLDRVIFKAKP